MPDYSKLLESFGEYVYSKFPPEYKRDDELVEAPPFNYPLKRFIGSIHDGGFRYALSDHAGILALNDPEKCPSKYLSFLFESYGFPYFPTIPEIYQRRFLKNIVRLYKIKGTIPCVEYLARELSGFDVLVKEEEVSFGFSLILISLMAREDTDAITISVNENIIKQYLRYFIPPFAEFTVVTHYIMIDNKYLPGETQDIVDLSELRGSFSDGVILAEDLPLWNTERAKWNDSVLFLNDIISLRYLDAYGDTRIKDEIADFYDKKNLKESFPLAVVDTEPYFDAEKINLSSFYIANKFSVYGLYDIKNVTLFKDLFQKSRVETRLFDGLNVTDSVEFINYTNVSLDLYLSDSILTFSSYYEIIKTLSQAIILFDEKQIALNDSNTKTDFALAQVSDSYKVNRLGDNAVKKQLHPLSSFNTRGAIWNKSAMFPNVHGVKLISSVARIYDVNGNLKETIYEEVS